MGTKLSLFSLFIAAFICTALASPAMADMFEPGFKIRAGGYWALLNSEITANDPDTGHKITIDFESDFGLEESKVSPYLELTYRFNENHALQVNAITLHRSSEDAGISKPFELEWDGKTYVVQAGLKLKTTLDLDVYQAAYMYSFYTSDQLMVAGTLGAHIAKITNEYEGSIGVKNTVSGEVKIETPGDQRIGDRSAA